MIVFDKKCLYRRPQQQRCQNISSMMIKVNVLHPHTFRKSTQIWYLCEFHIEEFLKSKGKGWVRWYNNTNNEVIVIGFDLLKNGSLLI